MLGKLSYRSKFDRDGGLLVFYLISCKSNFCVFLLQGHAGAFYTLEEGLWGTRGNGKSNSENRAGDSQAILNDILLTTLDT